MDHLNSEEARLVAVHRAIKKFNNPSVVNQADASIVTSYISQLIDFDELEESATDDQIIYFLDGLILGLGTMRLLEAEVPLEALPKAREEAAKEFQTGVDPITGNVKINK